MAAKIITIGDGNGRKVAGLFTLSKVGTKGEVRFYGTGDLETRADGTEGKVPTVGIVGSGRLAASVNATAAEAVAIRTALGAGYAKVMEETRALAKAGTPFVVALPAVAETKAKRGRKGSAPKVRADDAAKRRALADIVK